MVVRVPVSSRRFLKVSNIDLGVVGEMSWLTRDINDRLTVNGLEMVSLKCQGFYQPPVTAPS